MGQEQQLQQTRWGTAHGLTRADSVNICPRVVLKKQCLMSQVKMQRILGEDIWCLCQHSKVRALSDHARRWRIPRKKETVITYEPYGPSDQQIADLRGILTPMGITLWETWQWAWTEGTEILVLTKDTLTAADLKL